jgi:hypothetical protein
MGSVQRLDSLTASKQSVIVVFEGDDARKLHETGLFNPGKWNISPGVSGPRIQINPTWEWVAIIAILAAAAVSVVVMYLLFRMVVASLEHGFSVNVEGLKLGATEVEIAGQKVKISFPSLILRVDKN